MAVVTPETGIFDGVDKVRPGRGAYSSGARFIAALQGKRAESRNESRPFVVARNVRVGGIEPDAVPSPAVVDGGFQKGKAAADAFPARRRERLDGGRAVSDRRPFRGRGPGGRRGVVKRLAKKRQRRRAGLRLRPFGVAEFAARRKNHMRRGVGFFVHVNLVVLGQRNAEFRFDRSPGIREKTPAKFAVLAGFRYQIIRRVDGLVHRCLPMRIRQSAS